MTTTKRLRAWACSYGGYLGMVRARQADIAEALPALLAVVEAAEEWRDADAEPAEYGPLGWATGKREAAKARLLDALRDLALRVEAGENIE